MTPPQLAALLRPYDIRPRTLNSGDKRPKGYQRADFEDAFRRYLPARAATPQPGRDFEGLPENEAATAAWALRLDEGGFPRDSGEVAEVAAPDGTGGEETVEWAG